MWDDRDLIVLNDTLVQPGSILAAFTRDFWSLSESSGRSNYYRPLVTVSFILDRALFGLNPWGFHLTNLLIHSANCSLLAVLLVILGVPRLAAVGSAIVFAIHPAFGETVAWISGRSDSMAIMGMLLVVIAGRLAQERSRHSGRWNVIAALSFAIALCSKEIAVITPLISYIFARAAGDRSPLRGVVTPLTLIVFVGWCILRALALRNGLIPSVQIGPGLTTRFVSLLHVMSNLIWPPFFG